MYNDLLSTHLQYSIDNLVTCIGQNMSLYFSDTNSTGMRYYDSTPFITLLFF